MGSGWTEFDRAAVTSLLFLGHRPGSPAQPIVYPRKAEDRPHLAYYGTTRSGKTYSIEYALQQLARDRSAGFCYIDPHGSSYWRMASYLRQHNITDRVLYWDINDPEYVVSYDPFDVPGQSPAYIAGNVATALLATLGRQADPHEQAHLKTMTEAGLVVLVSLGLPFVLAHDLFNPGESRVKDAVAGHLSDSNLLKTIFARLPRFEERLRQLEAPYRRLDNLFRDDRLRLTFTTAGLNFRQLMDDGWIVLVNTEPKQQTDEAAILFTRLLVKSLFVAAKEREAADDPPPFFLAIDEASRYLTTDTAQILAQTAKFGLYLILGMQSIEQARRENEETYIAIRTTVNGEVVLRLTDYEEKLYFARRFFGDHFDFKSIKHEQVQTVAIPHTVAHVTSSHSRPVGPTESVSDSELPSGEHVRAAALSFAADVDVTTEGYHTEYEYQQLRSPLYYTPDELERLHAARFGRRSPGAVQRFGIVRVNEELPVEIEIPHLEQSIYSREEMVSYLREFKKDQPATLPLVEAERRSHEAVEGHLRRLTVQQRDPYTTARKPRRGTRAEPGPPVK